MYVLPQCWLTTTRVRVSSTSLRRSTNAVLAFLVARQLRTWVIDPSSTLYYRWLGVISAACLYNLIMIIARAVFWKLQEGHLLTTWLCFDYLCDVIYLLDIFVQFRTGK